MRLETDEEIARRVQAGDLEAFGVLVERYEEKLTRYGRKFLANAEDVKDMVQEIFLKAYTNIRSFDASRTFSPWIYRISHNEFVSALKKKSRLPLSLFDFDTLFPHPFAPETADDEVLRRETREMLDQYLDALDPRYREPLVLYYFEELGYQEIADVMRIPISTVGVRISRGKTLLQKIIDKKL